MRPEDEIRRVVRQNLGQDLEDEIRRALEHPDQKSLQAGYGNHGSYYPPRKPMNPTANNPETDGRKPPKDNSK